MRVGCLLALSAATLGSALEESSSATPLSRSLLKQKLKAMFDARDGVGEMDEFMSDEDLTHLYHSLLTHGVTSENGDSVPIPLGRKQGPSSSDGIRRSLLNSDWDDSDRLYALDLHNYGRNQTGLGVVGPDMNGDNWPSATNMNFLFWDDAVAAVAQAYSDKCIWEHNSNRNTEFYSYTDQCSFEYPSSSIYLGENIAYRATTGSMSVRSALYGNIMNGWYDEYKDGYYSPISSCDGCGVIGHYTQMVWSETRYLGCGFTICSDTWDGSTAQYNYYYLVCNYYAGGNYRGQYPYASGATCSNCDEDRKTCTGGQCGYCMYSGWDTNGDSCPSTGECSNQCDNNLGVTYSDSDATPGPTQSPTTKRPTDRPTNRPTPAPVPPTARPTDSPTKRPTDRPSPRPTADPTQEGETLSPTEFQSTASPTTNNDDVSDDGSNSDNGSANDDEVDGEGDETDGDDSGEENSDRKGSGSGGSSSSGDLSTGDSVGIGIGVAVLFVILLVCAGFGYYRYSQESNSSKPEGYTRGQPFLVDGREEEMVTHVVPVQDYEPPEVYNRDGPGFTGGYGTTSSIVKKPPPSGTRGARPPPPKPQQTYVRPY